MKKIILMTVMCVMTLSAMAQIKSVDVKGNLRGDFGLGVGITMPILENIDFAPNFNYYFTDGTVFTIDADFHYNFDLDQNWTLYPMIGLKYDCSGMSVERSMRTAIRIAVERGNSKTLGSLFGHTISIYKDNPTNSEFISIIAEKLRLQMFEMQSVA